MQPLKDASQHYEVERRARHAERPGFRINELTLSATQKVPWHYHSNVADAFYVLEGTIRIYMQQPKEEVRLAVGVLQGMGEYDFVPLLGERTRGAGD
jgi:quercetin dioxygenase-like cupin family protein